MSTSRGIADLEADIAALRATAERAGTALACLFSCADEFEADVVRERRQQGAYRASRRRWHPFGFAALTALLAVAFLLI